MGRGAKATGHGDAGDRHGGLLQQLAAAAQAQGDVVLRGGETEAAVEEPLQLTLRDVRHARQLLEGQRLLDVGFHQSGGLGNRRIAAAEPGGDRDALPILAVADALQDELLGDSCGQMCGRCAA